MDMTSLLDDLRANDQKQKDITKFLRIDRLRIKKQIRDLCAELKHPNTIELLLGYIYCPDCQEFWSPE